MAGRIATQKVYGELFTNAKEDIKTAKILTHQITEEFSMTEEYFTSPQQVQYLLAEANDEVKSLLSKLDTVVVVVKEYLLDNESISAIKTKELINEMF